MPRLALWYQLPKKTYLTVYDVLQGVQINEMVSQVQNGSHPGEVRQALNWSWTAESDSEFNAGLI